MATVFDFDNVEIKVSVFGDIVTEAVQAFDLADDAAKIRRIWFGEIPTGADRPLPMSARGLIVRIRLGRHNGTTTLKLRGPDGCVSPSTWRKRAADWGDHAKLEGDWSGDRRLVSASLDNDVTADHGFDSPQTPADVQAMMSSEQLGLAGEWIMPVDRLQPLGPIAADSWTATIAGMPADVSFERWTVSDSRFLELSIRVTAVTAAKVQPRLVALLTDVGSTWTPIHRQRPKRSCVVSPQTVSAWSSHDLPTEEGIVKVCGSAFHAAFGSTPWPVDRMTSLSFSNRAPARTRATRCGALTARQRC